MEAETNQQREPERDCIPERRDPEQPTAKALVIDLEAREQKEKRQPEQAHHLDRRVDRNPTQDVRPDHNPEQDLEHDRRQPNPREQSEGQRRRQRRRRDNS